VIFSNKKLQNSDYQLLKNQLSFEVMVIKEKLMANIFYPILVKKKPHFNCITCSILEKSQKVQKLLLTAKLAIIK